MGVVPKRNNRNNKKCEKVLCWWWCCHYFHFIFVFCFLHPQSRFLGSLIRTFDSSGEIIISQKNMCISQREWEIVWKFSMSQVPKFHLFFYNISSSSSRLFRKNEVIKTNVMITKKVSKVIYLKEFQLLSFHLSWERSARERERMPC